jgi:octanoyl-[GcvH]:protein N-octanoyltransferase
VNERRTIWLIREGLPTPPTRDTAVSHAILRRVSDGELPETIRLHRPGPIVAFGPKDRLAAGFSEAVEAARALGFGSVQRLAGGRAAVFHEGTLAFSWAIPDAAPRLRIRSRFEEVATMVAEALRDLGIDARVGEVPGEYCPGEFSVNAKGRTKLVGLGQRLVQRAAHVGGVIVVTGSDRIRSVLLPVYRSLDLEWDPSTTGSLEDEVPGMTWDQAANAVLRRFEERFDVREEPRFDQETMALALELEARHVVVTQGQSA